MIWERLAKAQRGVATQVANRWAKALSSRLALVAILLLAPITVGLLLRIQKAWADVSTIVLEATPDDAFYYFQIARSIANGHNVTFDGETLTNGFHPLWMALLTPLYLMSDDPELPVHLGLTMGALLSVGTVLLAYVIVTTLTGNRWAALAGATFYALHPYLIVESVNGMETSLTVFTVALTTWLFLRIACRSERSSRADYAWLGVSAGFMVLARTDMVFVLPAVLLYFIARERGWERWRGALVTGGTALLVVAPWAIWGLVNFGTVIQVSGLAVPDIERQAFLAAHGSSFATQLDRAWDVTNDALFHQLPHLFFVPRGAPRIPALLAGLGIVGFMLVAPLTPQRRQVARQMGLLLVPTVGIVSMLLFHSAIRWHLRDWYFAPTALVGAAFLGIAVNYVDSVLNGTHLSWRTDRQENSPARLTSSAGPVALRRWRGWAIAALYGLVALALVGVYGPQQSQHWVLRLPHRVNMLEAGQWLADNTDSQARIGSFNAGIIGYFSERTVINLDGVVNEGAYKARRDGRLLEYMCSKQIRYLVDVEVADLWLSAGCGEHPSLSLRLVTTIGRKLSYFGGGQIDVLEFVPVAVSAFSGCAGITSDCSQGSGLAGPRPRQDAQRLELQRQREQQW